MVGAEYPWSRAAQSASRTDRRVRNSGIQTGALWAQRGGEGAGPEPHSKHHPRRCSLLLRHPEASVGQRVTIRVESHTPGSESWSLSAKVTFREASLPLRGEGRAVARVEGGGHLAQGPLHPSLVPSLPPLLHPSSAFSGLHAPFTESRPGE